MESKYHGKQLFVQVEDWVVEVLMSDQLTRTDHRLFWYLFKLDRWGDRFVPLPSQSEIALALGVSRQTINNSQAKLESLKLWDFRMGAWQGRNLVAPYSGNPGRPLNQDDSESNQSDTLSNEPDNESNQSDTLSNKSDNESNQSDRVSNESDRVSNESDRVSNEFDRDIYKDRTRDQTNTDLRETKKDTHTDPEAVENFVGVEIEVAAVEVILEEPPKNPIDAQGLKQEVQGEPANPYQGSFPAAPQGSENVAKKLRSGFAKDLNGKDIFPWDLPLQSPERGKKFHPDFERHMARSLMGYPAYQNLMAGELMVKVRKHIAGARHDLKRRDELLIEWDGFQSGETHPTSTMTAKGASRRAKLARALGMDNDSKGT